jgi:hypothetical protein
MKQTTDRPQPALHIPSPRRARAHTPTMKQTVRTPPDAYAKFVGETSQEAKDDFYMKLAGILLKKTQDSLDD